MRHDFPPYERMLENSVALAELEAANDEPDPDEEYEIERAEADYEREIADGLREVLVEIVRRHG